MRGAVGAPVAVKVPAAGSYVSAVCIVGSTVWPVVIRSELVVPPTTSTLPSASGVAVCHSRGIVMEPVALNVPVVGSNSSASPVGTPDGLLGSGVAPTGAGATVCPREQDTAVLEQRR